MNLFARFIETVGTNPAAPRRTGPGPCPPPATPSSSTGAAAWPPRGRTFLTACCAWAACAALDPAAPFVGWKASALGPPEHGRWERDFYARPQTVYAPPV